MNADIGHQAWEEYEHDVWQAVTMLELRHNVRIAVELIDRRDESETAAWLAAIEAAAVSSEHEVQRVESPMGRAEVRRAGSPTPERTFVGAAAHETAGIASAEPSKPRPVKVKGRCRSGCASTHLTASSSPRSSPRSIGPSA